MIYVWVCVYNLFVNMREDDRGQVMVRPAEYPMAGGYGGYGHTVTTFPESSASTYDEPAKNYGDSRPMTRQSFTEQEEPYQSPDSQKLATIA